MTEYTIVKSEWAKVDGAPQIVLTDRDGRKIGIDPLSAPRELMPEGFVPEQIVGVRPR